MAYLFRKGDRVRLENKPYNQHPTKIIPAGTLGIVREDVQARGFNGDTGYTIVPWVTNEGVSVGCYAHRLTKLTQEEETVTQDTSKAMPFAVAVEKAQVLNRESGNKGFYRVRQRSWDKIGLYAAVDVYGPGDVNPRRRLYTLQDVGAEMTCLVAQRTPIDVVGEKSSMYTYLSFKTPQGQLLYAPDGSKWWNERQVRNCGGIVSLGTQRYRLCTRVTTHITGRAFQNDVHTDEVVPIVP